MKKLVLAIVLIMSIVGLTACDPTTGRFKYDELKDRIISIQLIEYDNPSVKELPESVELPIISCSWSRKPDPIETQPFDFTKVKALETLSEDKIDAFLQELSKIELVTIDTINYGCTDSANGITIILNCKNGDFLVLSANNISELHCNFIGWYDVDGNVIDHTHNWWEYEDFYNLVNDYFTAYHFD